MSKHTPGPWFFRRAAHPVVSGIVGFDVLKQGQGVVAEMHVRPYAPVIVNEANARLIAAAPDLLAACEAIIEEQSIGMYGAISNEGIAQLRAAIARATEA